MAKIDLMPNEAIILRDSQMKHDQGKGFSSESDELLLTNQALIVIHKGFFGTARDVQRFPLDQVAIVNGAPRVMIGMSQDGERQLHVYFHHGIEAFSLGESDEDAQGSLIDLLFVSEKDKENRNLRQWQAAISQVVASLPQNTSVATPQMQAAPAVAASNQPASQNTQTAVIHATKKCIGCMAPLSGVQGQKTTCKYCDTEQAL